MTKPKSLLKTFSLYGLGFLGVLYIFCTVVLWIFIGTSTTNDWGLDWWPMRILSIVFTLGCFSAVGWVIRKLWLVSGNSDARNIWVYPSILFIAAMSVVLFTFNLLAFALMLWDEFD